MRNPTPIPRGKPTMNTFIWGTVLAMIPKATLVKKSVIIAGADIFIAMTKTSTHIRVIASPIAEGKEASPGGINWKLCTIPDNRK